MLSENLEIPVYLNPLGLDNIKSILLERSLYDNCNMRIS